MGFVLDIILVIIAVLCVVYGCKKGFFKTVMSLMSGVCALLCAYTFTPAFSAFLKEKFIIDKVAGSIEKTFASIAENGKDAAENVLYDLTKLLSSPQFKDTLEQCGADEGAVMSLIESADEGTHEVIESVAYEVAEPISSAFSDIAAFIIVFCLSFILICVAVRIVGLIFKLPVLKSFDKAFGFAFGAVSAVFFVWVFSLCADTLAGALEGIAPGSFSTEMIEKSFLVEFFAKYNPIGAILSDIL